MVPSITKLVTEPEIRYVVINQVNAGDQTRNCLLDYLILAVLVFRSIIFKPIILNVMIGIVTARKLTNLAIINKATCNKARNQALVAKYVNVRNQTIHAILEGVFGNQV